MFNPDKCKIMAKVTDYNEIMTEVTTQLSENEWSILDYVDEETAKLIVTNIYTSNDVMKGYGQDIRGWISVISSRYYISVIRADEMGMFKSDVPICGYENLSEDIAQILMIMQAAFDRML